MPVNAGNLLINVSPDSSGIHDSSHLFSTGETPFRVRDIVIVGNKRTRREIILREIPFKSGETFLLQELVRRFEDARRQLMNTALFHTVVVALKSFDGYDIDILVQVRERWYIFSRALFQTG